MANIDLARNIAAVELQAVVSALPSYSYGAGLGRGGI